MVFELTDTATLAGVVEHRDAQTPLVVDVTAREGIARCDILVLLEQSGDDKGLQDEPPTEIHAPDLVRRVVPRLVQRLRERLSARTAVERVARIVHPCMEGALAGWFTEARMCAVTYRNRRTYWCT